MKTELPKLVTVDAINKLIDNAVKATQKAHDLRHNAAVQALLHFEKHGDTALIARYMDLMRSVPGVLVPAYTKWFTDHSPVLLAVSDGHVVATKDKEETAKPFRVETAFNNPAEKTAEAIAALTKPLADFSADYFRERLIAMSKSLAKAANGEGKRGVAGDTEQLDKALGAALKAFDATLKA